MRVGEQIPQAKSIHHYAQQLGQTPRKHSSERTDIPHVKVEDARDEKPPLTFPRELAHVQSPKYSSRQNSSYQPQLAPQRAREAQVSQAHCIPAGPRKMEYAPQMQQRFEQYQKVPQAQVQSGMYSKFWNAEDSDGARVNGEGVTRVVEKSPYRLVDMPQAQQQLAHFCSSSRPEGEQFRHQRYREDLEPRGQRQVCCFPTVESEVRAFEALIDSPHFALEWDPPKEPYSTGGAGDAVISGVEGGTMTGSSDVAEMTRPDSSNCRSFLDLS